MLRIVTRSSHRLGLTVMIFLLGVSTHVNAGFSKAEVIDINNPQFRKLVFALPPQAINGGEPVVQNFAGDTAGQLHTLLEFTGFFKIISEQGYRGANSGDYASWKALGIDAIITSKIARSPAPGAYTIALKAEDVLQGREALATSETFHNNRELLTQLKHFVDRLLEIYTNRPGIFSSRIVFIGKRERKQEGQVFICDIDGQNVEQITFAPKVAHLSPSWSNDGSKILYTSYSSGKPDLYLYEVSTGKVDKVASQGSYSSGGVFSRNGKIVAFSQSTKGLTRILLKNLEKKETKPLTNDSRGLNVDPTFSPDGKWLASVSDRFGNPHIFLSQLAWGADGQSLVVEAERRLTYAGKQNVTPAWSPDSQKLAFAGLDPTVGRFDIFKMNLDGTYLERLTQFEGSNENPSWSPNGQHLVYHSNRSGAAQLYLMHKDGSSQQLIPTGLYEAKTPDWGPQPPSKSLPPPLVPAPVPAPAPAPAPVPAP